MALIKCFECNKEISENAQICPYCGVDLKKEKRKKDYERKKNKAYTIKDLQQRNIKNFYGKHKKVILDVVIFIIVIIIGIITYSNYYNSKLNEVRQALQGKWHDYTKIDEEYVEWQIEIDDNTLIDIIGNMYQIQWYPYKNYFVANNVKYYYSKDYNTITYIDFNFTKPKMYDDINTLFETKVDKKESVVDPEYPSRDYALCSGTIINNSNYFFKYIELEVVFTNLSNQKFASEIYEIRDLKPNATETFSVKSEIWFLNSKPQWTMQDCIINIKNAET